jgi:hypothetical protein
MPFLHTVAIEPRETYRLHVTFNNGVTGDIDLASELWGEVFEPLKDPQLFNTARQHPELGTVTWANGADLAPEYLFDLLQKQTKAAA